MKVLLHALVLVALTAASANTRAAPPDFETEIRSLVDEIRADHDAATTSLDKTWARLSENYDCAPPGRFGTECKLKPTHDHTTTINGIHRRIRVGTPKDPFFIDEITVQASDARIDVPTLMRKSFKEWQPSADIVDDGPLPCDYSYQLRKTSDAKRTYQLRLLFTSRLDNCAAPVNQVTFALIKIR